MERIDIWFSDKKEQGVEKKTKNGHTVWEFFGRAQTEAYDAWEAANKQGDQPERYVNVTVSVWDAEMVKHVRACFAKRRADDPRPHLHAAGQWGRSREWEGKQYADFTARDASPLIWGPLSKRPAQ